MSEATIKTLVSSLTFMAVTGLSLGLLIALISHFFAVKADERVEKVEELLPGANCGGCGFAGCSAFAKAIVNDDVNPSKCPVNSAEMSIKIAEYLGRQAILTEPQVALVKCCGDNVNSPERALYNGINDCNSAVLVAGATKACQYGCIGLASCARACPFNAIEINEFNIAIIHPELCVGCAKCVATCPRKLIAMVPKSAPIHVLCNSPERASIQRAACKKGCIGCRKCVDISEGRIALKGQLAVVDYQNPPTNPEIVTVCPVKCIQPTLGLTLDYSVKKSAPAPAVRVSNEPQSFHLNLGIGPNDDEATVKKAFALKMGSLKKSLSPEATEAEKLTLDQAIGQLNTDYKSALAFIREQQTSTPVVES